jgi:hypothetical protein
LSCLRPLVCMSMPLPLQHVTPNLGQQGWAAERPNLWPCCPCPRATRGKWQPWTPLCRSTGPSSAVGKPPVQQRCRRAPAGWALQHERAMGGSTSRLSKLAASNSIWVRCVPAGSIAVGGGAGQAGAAGGGSGCGGAAICTHSRPPLVEQLINCSLPCYCCRRQCAAEACRPCPAAILG